MRMVVVSCNGSAGYNFAVKIDRDTSLVGVMSESALVISKDPQLTYAGFQAGPAENAVEPGFILDYTAAQNVLPILDFPFSAGDVIYVDIQPAGAVYVELFFADPISAE
jgi:hypothetical protein